MLETVYDTRGNKYKLVLSMILQNIYLLTEQSIYGMLYLTM